MMNPTGDARSPQDRRRELLRRRIAESGLAATDSAEAAPHRTPRPAEHYRLSAGQRRMWFLQEMDPGDTTLNICVAYRLTGALDETRLRDALAEVVARHSILRTTYSVGGDGEPYQQFRDDVGPQLRVDDLRGTPQADADRQIEALVRTEFARPFRLGEDRPLRVTLIRAGVEDFVLAIVVHHICWDDDCWDVFFDELNDAYHGRRPGGPAPQYLAVEPPADPADPAASVDEDVAYWRDALRPVPEPVRFPGAPPAAAAGPAGRCTRPLPAALFRRVEDFARSRSATPFMVLLSAFAALVHRYTEASDFLVAVPLTGRRGNAEGAVGYFGNTLLLRTAPAAQDTFAGLVDAVRETCLAGFSHASAGVDRVVGEVNPLRTPGRDGLGELVGLAFSMRKSVQRIAFDGVTARQLDLGSVSTQLPLSLTVVVDPDAAAVEFEYQTGALAAELVDQMSAHYLRLLDGALRDPQCRLAALDMLDTAERAAVLAGSHGAVAAAPPTTMVAILEAAAAATPDGPAVVTDATRLSYAQLHRGANRLARWLIGNGIGTEDVIGLRMGASAEFVTAALAVWKAGAAYLPIDPAYPADRIDYLVADGRPRMVVGPDEFEAAARAAAGLPDTPLTDADRVRPLRPSNLAYVIYTSGSTGRPKGVAVAHAAIAEHLTGFAAEWNMTAGDRMLQSSSVSFDASLAEIFLTLSIGAQLVVPDAGAFDDIDRLAGLIERHRVTVLHLVPSALDTLLLLPPDERWRRLRLVPVGGEALAAATAAGFADRFDAELRNHYGPTEAVVCSTHQPVTRRHPAGAVPIGTPNRNVSAYVLDRRLQPVPPDVVGELYLGGDQLARGYLGRAGLTAERFVADPFRPGMRLYRSGDLVRRNRRGELEFVGRADDQVKVRGFRIELGEVESAIASHPSVRHCVVVADDGEFGVTLAAHLVPSAELDFDEVRRHAATLLPDYMVPNAFAVIDRIPLTAAGKLDRRALPAPAHIGAGRHRAPVTPTEQRVCAIFAGLFGREPVGADDSFFALGGHSLLAARLVAQLRAEFGVELAIRAVFDTPSPAGLAARLVEQFRAEFDIDLDALDADPGVAAPAAPVRTPGRAGPARPQLAASVRPERIPLSYSQLAGWFQHRIDATREAFAMPLVLRFTGPVDAASLALALDDVVARHDALRMTFGEHEGVPYQVVQPARHVDLLLRQVGADRLAETIAELRRQRLTPESGALLGAALLTVDPNTHVLVVTVHHLVSDHASLEIIVDDLTTAYRARLSGRPLELPETPISFADYVLWQRNTFDSPGEWAQAELAHWQQRLAGLPDEVSVPADRPRRPVLAQRGEVAGFTLPAAVHAAVLRLAEDTGATEFMVYHAAVAVLLHKLGCGTDIAVGSPASARADPAAAGLVGLLANAVVLRTDLSGDPSLRTLARRSGETVLDAFAHQEVPVERLVDALQPARSGFRNPLYQTMIHFRGADWASAPRDLTGTGETTLVPLRTDFDGSLLDLDLAMTVTAAGDLDVRVVADADLYSPATVRHVADALHAVLDAFAAGPDRPLSALRLPPAPVAAEPGGDTKPAAGKPDPLPTGSAETERTLIALLEELLDITGVDPDDNFFALGGDSIISIKWAAAATARGLALTPAMVFEHLTLGELAAAVDAAAAGPEPPAGGDTSGYAPMSASGLDADALARLTEAWQGRS